MQQPTHKQADVNLPKPPGPPPIGYDAEDGRGPGPETKWKEKNNWIIKWVLIFRSFNLGLSFITIILVIAFGEFYKDKAMSYLLGVAFLTMFYMIVQVGIKGHEFRTKKDLISPKIAVWIDFCGDQLFAYMLFSSGSATAAISTANREVLLIDSGLELMGGAVATSLFAFMFLAPVTLVSGFRLVTILSTSINIT